jgi:hypothetical protein
MRRLGMSSLALALGLGTGFARAGDDGWSTPPRPAAVDARPAAELGRPVAAPSVAAPAALDKPRPLAPVADPQVRPAGYGDLPSVVRGQTTDAAKPLPTGAPDAPPSAAPVVRRNWQPGPIETAPAPAPDPVPSDCDSCRRPLWNLFAHLHMDDCDCSPPERCSCGPDWTGGCCPPGNKWFGSAEYLLWWTKGSPLPPLVTAGSAQDAIPGALGQPGTALLFGGNNVIDGARSGGRFTAGYWFGDEHCLGLEGSFFFLGQDRARFSATSSGSPILARPFFDVGSAAPAGGVNNAELVSRPGVLAGTVSSSLTSRFWGAEANLRSNVWCGPALVGDALVGYRYLRLDETLRVNENLTVLAGGGGAFAVADQFKVHNDFNAGQVGFDAEFRRNRWFLDLKTKVALGDVHQTVNISGATVITDPATGVTRFPGGLLAQTTNIGNFSRDRFAWSPDVGVNLGYQLTDHCRAYVGYDFLYLSSVVRPGDQVDLTVNSNLLPPAMPGGPNRPAFSFHGSDYWAQGLNFGLEFRF